MSLSSSAQLIAMGLAVAAYAADLPPAARTVNVVDHAFGLTLPDPYRWMEGENNAEFKTWLTGQGAYTRAQLDAAPNLAAWRSRLKAASAGTVINRLQQRVAGRIFFLRLENGKGAVLMVRDADGTERVLLDPATQSTGTSHANITQYSPSPNGKLVAVNVDHGGSEVTTIEVLDVATAQALPDAIERVWGEFNAAWLTDASGFTYTQMAPAQPGVDAMLNMRARLHRLGTPVQDDPQLMAVGQHASFPLKPAEFASVDLSNESPYAVGTAGGARKEIRLCVTPKAEVQKPDAKWQCVVDYADRVAGYALQGKTLYLQSNKGASNGQVLALDLSRPKLSLKAAKVFVPESKNAVITALAVARDALYLRSMTDGIDHFTRVDYGTGKASPLPMPFAGAAYALSSQPREDGLVLTLQSWTRPRVAFAYEPMSNSFIDLKLGASTAGDYSDIESTETVAVSRDGTQVPLSIIYRKGIAHDGKNLALLDGYGGYGDSLQPYFDPMVLEWVKAGHVYAVAHVRGGGERGDAWWRDGKSEKKHKGIEDFVACAEQLSKLGFTQPALTGADGASMGGVLIGGAVTLAPDRFGAAVIHAGMLNPVRLLAGTNGENQIAELADPRTAAGLKVMAAMDPYQRIKPGEHYPAVLLAVGVNDSRVSPWESGKFGAKLRTATASGKPIWYRTNGDAGHFTDSLDDTAAEAADTYTFLEIQLHL